MLCVCVVLRTGGGKEMGLYNAHVDWAHVLSNGRPSARRSLIYQVALVVRAARRLGMMMKRCVCEVDYC